jgi:hypothetical protein
MSRWKAAAIHLSISAGIAVIACALFFGVWYPGTYFHAAGADELVILLVGVDLAIGPLLTLLVFRTGKRGLRFDLTSIAMAQAVALMYGCHVVLESRPIFLVAALDRFVLVSANEISDEDLNLASERQFRSRSWAGPKLVGAVLPTDIEERNKLVFEAASGHDIQTQPKFYRPYETVRESLLTHAKSLDSLMFKGTAPAETIQSYLAKSDRKPDSIVWLPLQTRKTDAVMLVDKTSGTPLKALPIDPW